MFECIVNHQSLNFSLMKDFWFLCQGFSPIACYRINCAYLHDLTWVDYICQQCISSRFCSLLTSFFLLLKMPLVFQWSWLWCLIFHLYFQVMWDLFLLLFIWLKEFLFCLFSQKAAFCCIDLLRVFLVSISWILVLTFIMYCLCWLGAWFSRLLRCLVRKLICNFALFQGKRLVLQDFPFVLHPQWWVAA